MFRWYQNASKCYVYLSDVLAGDGSQASEQSWKQAFRKSRWFTRGWTLQELLAPRSVLFFSLDGQGLGDKSALEEQICDVTGITIEALRGEPLSKFSKDKRMTWAAARETTIEEDQIYCLLGIFGVYLPLIYGEGREHAYQRLVDDIDRRSSASAQVHASLAHVDYERFKDRNPDRIQGTCQWVLQHENFKAWRENRSSSLLWVSADPGSGKSVLAKSIVDEDLKESDDLAVCHFFFKDDSETQRSITTALSALLHQLFSQRPRLVKYAMKDHAANGDKFSQSFDKLFSTLIGAATDPELEETICVLDASDECDDPGRHQIIKALDTYCRQLHSGGSAAQLKFLVTSRPYLDIERRFTNLVTNFPSIRLQGQQESDTIRREIDTVIKWRVAELASELRLNSPERFTLEAELMSMTNRTYLWLKLMFDIVRETTRPTSQRLTSIIGSIPATVDKAYEAILAKIRDDEIPQATKLFHILVAAVRPLSLKEMNIALAIEPQHECAADLDLDDEQRFEASLRDISGLFVTVVDHKVYLIHQTARTFLVARAHGCSTGWKYSLKGQEPASQLSIADPQRRHTGGFSIDLEVAHAVITTTCLQYLAFSDFNVLVTGDTMVQALTEEHPFLRYAAVHWPIHLQNSHSNFDRVFESQLRWFMHPERYQNTYRLWKSLTCYIFPESTFFISSPLLFSIAMGLRMPVNMMLPQLPDVNTYSAGGITGLAVAAGENEVAMMRKLLELGANVDLPTLDRGLTPLHLAAENACEEAVELLVACGASLHSRSHSGSTPFYRAARGGSSCILTFLHDKGCEVDAKTWDNWTPLMEAVEQGHESAVMLLLGWGANPRNCSSHLTTPLSLAISHENTSIRGILETAISNSIQQETCSDNGKRSWL